MSAAAAIANAPTTTATQQESCPVCYDDYKGKKIVKLTCQYCPAHACRGCQQRYLLQSYEDPNCLECKRGWSPEFMAVNFPLSFRNDTLRKHRRKILLEREKAMLPAMQTFVGYKREIDALQVLIVERHKRLEGTSDSINATYWVARNKHNTLLEQMRQVRIRIHELKRETEETLPTRSQELATARKRRAELRVLLETSAAALDAITTEKQREVDALHTLIRQRERLTALYEGRLTGETGARHKREFIMRCPADDCRGFLSTAYKCGTCSKHACPDCLVVLPAAADTAAAAAAPHTCDPAIVENVKVIKSETRPCPKCGTRIFKIDGCDMMFCTMEGCATAFSWNTGQIETGRIHNPHYYEWLRRTGGGTAPREAGDLPCGGLPYPNQLFRLARRHAIDRGVLEPVFEIHRNLSELVEGRLRTFPATADQMMNKEHDVAYLMNRIDEAEWQRQLEFNEAKFRRKREIGQILQMLATAGSDAYNRLLAQSVVLEREEEEIGANVNAMNDWMVSVFLPELETLREFANESLRSLAKREHMAVPQIGPQWEWIPLRALYKATGAKKTPGSAEAVAEEEVIDLSTAE